MTPSTTATAGYYNDTVVRQFSIMSVVWGVVGMLVGVLIASQLAWPELNFGIPWLSYGRLRPLHTNAVIFAFGGSALIGTSYYVVQRTCQVRLFGGWLAAFSFWGWQLVILAAAISLPMGYNSSKEYAELEWPIDILITLVWVAYAIVFFGTIGIRKVRHIYVANWFYGAFILTIAVLHLVNSAAIPVIPLYVSIAFKIMKEKGIHENPIEQANRLFHDRLYRADGVAPATDEEGRLRLDDWELREDVQEPCQAIWPTVTTENLREITDYAGYKHEFLKLFGFDREDMDYEAEVEADRRFDCLEL